MSCLTVYTCDGCGVTSDLIGRATCWTTCDTDAGTVMYGSQTRFHFCAQCWNAAVSEFPKCKVDFSGRECFNPPSRSFVVTEEKKA